MGTRKVKSERVKLGDIICQDDKEHMVTNILYDEVRSRYLITGTGGYYSSVPRGKTLRIRK